MDLHIEFGQEDDGRWFAIIDALPGVMAYGPSRQEAESKVQALALRVLAEDVERESAPIQDLHFEAA